jgi:hypothetical protein
MVTWSLKKNHLGSRTLFILVGRGGLIRHKLNPAYEDVEKMAIIIKKI